MAEITTLQLVGSDATQKSNIRNIIDVALRQHGFTAREVAVDTIEVYVVPLGSHPEEYDPKAGYATPGDATGNVGGDGSGE